MGWTVEYDDMNATFEVQDQSLDWLDSLSHLLEYFAYTFRRLNDRIEPKERWLMAANRQLLFNH